MKNVIIVSIFFAGIVIGMYLLKPVLVDSSNDTDNSQLLYENCQGYYEDDNWYMNRNLTEAEQTLIIDKYNELLIEYEITDEELLDDHYLMHEIMEELWQYADDVGIEYIHPIRYHMGGMHW